MKEGKPNGSTRLFFLNNNDRNITYKVEKY